MAGLVLVLGLGLVTGLVAGLVLVTGLGLGLRVSVSGRFRVRVSGTVKLGLVTGLVAVRVSGG